MEYVCKVATPAGEIVQRTFSAQDEGSLRTELEQQGYYLFSARRPLGPSFSFGPRRVRTPLLLIFGQELAALLKAGLPLFQALDVMLERQRDPVFRRSLETIKEKVRSGVALSEAVRSEGALYPPIFSASLFAGERSGSLEAVLRRFVSYLRLNQALKKRAIAASVYPAVLFTAMLALVGILMFKVIPQFQGFYEGLDVRLPLATRVLMAIATGLSRQVFWIILLLVIAVMTVASWARRPGADVAVDRALLRVPYLGPLMRMYATSQLARTLSTLLAGGLPLLNALDVAAASVSNRAMAAGVAQATPQIREGRSLASALESTGLLDNLAIEMVKVGEHTGALADMLGALAEFYDEELETRLATALALVEPVILVLMAVIVAGMLLAFYLPLFEAISAVQRTV